MHSEVAEYGTLAIGRELLLAVDVMFVEAVECERLAAECSDPLLNSAAQSRLEFISRNVSTSCKKAC